MHGQGRVFYTSLGHREDMWTNPFFQGIAQAGLEWVLGDRDAVRLSMSQPNRRASVTPQAEPIEEPARVAGSRVMARVNGSSRDDGNSCQTSIGSRTLIGTGAMMFAGAALAARHVARRPLARPAATTKTWITAGWAAPAS